MVRFSTSFSEGRQSASGPVWPGRHRPISAAQPKLVVSRKRTSGRWGPSTIMGGEPSFAGATRDRKQNGRGHRPEQKGGGEAQCLQSQDEEAGKAEEDRPFQPGRPITKQRGE